MLRNVHRSLLRDPGKAEEEALDMFSFVFSVAWPLVDILSTSVDLCLLLIRITSHNLLHHGAASFENSVRFQLCIIGACRLTISRPKSMTITSILAFSNFHTPATMGIRRYRVVLLWSFTRFIAYRLSLLHVPFCIKKAIFIWMYQPTNFKQMTGVVHDIYHMRGV